MPDQSLIQLSLAMAILGAGVALLIGWLARPIGTRLGLLDWPDTNGGRKQHGRVTPLVGGLALTIAVLAAALIARAFAPAMVAHDLGWLAFCVGAMFIIGVSDDRIHLSPVVRLMAAMVVLVLVISQVPDFALAFLYFGGADRILLLGAGGAGFTLICLLGLLNAVNMADGKNGVVIGQGIIWSIVLAVHLPPPFWPVLAASFGVLAGLLWFNMRGKLFLGDGGSYAISSLFGLLAVLSYNHGFESWRAGDVALLFAVPVLDTVRLMVVRLARRRSPFEGDRDHLHHHLYARLGWPRGLGVYLALVALPNAAALLIPQTGWLWLAVTALVYGVIIRLTTLTAEELSQGSADQTADELADPAE